MARDMLINYVAGEECRIALVEDGRLGELYSERVSDDIHVGNIYRGRVTNVEASIQAAFIDFGLDRNGFLHISDLHPRYFGRNEQTERVGKRTPRRDRPPIQQALRRGDQVLVQVLKEGIGTKGPTLTSYLSIPGRFLVMMPDMERHGVSRKVDDEDARREMRKILDELDPPEEFGFIVRTAGIGRTKTELKRDLAYLQRLWKTMDRRMTGSKGPMELYRESDLVIRTLRDVLTSEVERIIVDDPQAAARARDFLRIAAPRGSTRVYYYDQAIPLLDAFDIERQIADITARQVPMPSGGSLVIDSTEALVAIDVNSGKMRDNKDAETTAYKTNCEAVDEIARQLRLRDLGGVIVLDLIDMYQHKHRRDIERRMRDNLKQDRARSKVTRINDLGLMSMTRQRMRPGIKQSINRTCPTCDGHGLLKTAESVAFDAMRQLAVVMSCDRVAKVELTVTPETGAMLLNRKRQSIHQLEHDLGKSLKISFDDTLRPDELKLSAFDERGVTLAIDKLPPPKPPKVDSMTLVDENASIETEVEDEISIDYEDDADTGNDSADDSGHANPKAQSDEAGETDDDDAPKKKRRRRRRGGRRHRRRRERAESEAVDGQPATDEPANGGDASDTADDDSDGDNNTASHPGEDATEGGDDASKKKRRRRRGGRRRRNKSNGENETSGESVGATQSSDNGSAATDRQPDEPQPRVNEDATKPEPKTEPKIEPAPEPATEAAAEETPAAKTTKKKTTKKKTTKKKTSKKITKKKTTKKKTTKKKTSKKSKASAESSETAEAGAS